MLHDWRGFVQNKSTCNKTFTSKVTFKPQRELFFHTKFTKKKGWTYNVYLLVVLPLPKLVGT